MTDPSNLRAAAEAALGRVPENRADLTPEEARRTLHELRVHQIELEMQNEELRRAQAELEASHSRYFDLYDLAPTGYLTLSRSGQIVEANFTAATLLGVTRAALMRKSLAAFVYGQDQNIYYLFRKQLAATQAPQICELRMLKKDGTRCWVRLDVTVTHDATATSRVVLSDISARKQAEDALRIKDVVFDAALSANSIADPDGIITETNAAFLRLWGYTGKAEVVGQPITAFIRNPNEATAILTALDATGQWEGDYVALKRDGSTFIANGLATTLRNGQGVLLGYQSAVLDVTGHRHAEELQRQSEHLLRESQAVAGMGSYVLDIASGVWRSSEMLDTLFGIDASYERTTEGWSRLVHPDDRTLMVDYLTTEVLGMGRTFDKEYRIIRHHDQAERWVHGQGKLKFDAHGRPIQMLGTIRDITSHKRVENVMAFLARTSSGTAGEPFFHALARFLARSLGMDFVCIDRLEGDGLTARTVTFWHDGQFEDNLCYALKDTPCGELAGQLVCCFPSKVCELFPHDPMLLDMQAESYVGVTLWSHNCQPIGLIAVIGRQPLADRALAESTLKLVAVRAAGELERLQAEENIQMSLREKDSLLKEVHHRVKNNLQIISSLLSLQAGQIDNPTAQAALRDMQRRVRSMALIHEHLYRSESLAAVDLASYLTQLCQQLLRALVAQPGTIQLHLDLAPIRIGIDQAIPCGLLVNELVSNAFEHAFPQGLSGEVRVTLQALPDSAGWRLSVADNGAGLPPDFTLDHLTTLGLRLVSDLTRQLGGCLTIGPGPGTAFEVEVGRAEH